MFSLFFFTSKGCHLFTLRHLLKKTVIRVFSLELDSNSGPLPQLSDALPTSQSPHIHVSLNPGLGIRSFAHRSFTHSLILNQMSDSERFAQIPQDK